MRGNCNSRSAKARRIHGDRSAASRNACAYFTDESQARSDIVQVVLEPRATTSNTSVGTLAVKSDRSIAVHAERQRATFGLRAGQRI
jgi:hypothetical protein